MASKRPSDKVSKASGSGRSSGMHVAVKGRSQGPRVARAHSEPRRKGNAPEKLKGRIGG